MKHQDFNIIAKLRIRHLCDQAYAAWIDNQSGSAAAFIEAMRRLQLLMAPLAYQMVLHWFETRGCI